MLPVSIYADFNITRIDKPKRDSILETTTTTTMKSIPQPETQLKRSAPFALVIQTGLLPPVGAAIFKISTAAVHDVLPLVGGEASASKRHLIESVSVHDEKTTLDVSNGLFTVKFDR
jgi:hypothetical protein